ncbi:unnamed protein product [Ostreobium quekettii]|uniref:Uncharacterized protein n=1 Tax=Ostreobium quekettii TaxID=121088 RepID=A0A8S1J7W5_9CHLO|nr:unnamed protein product [Ostreobium quekettii]
MEKGKQKLSGMRVQEMGCYGRDSMPCHGSRKPGCCGPKGGFMGGGLPGSMADRHVTLGIVSVPLCKEQLSRVVEILWSNTPSRMRLPGTHKSVRRVGDVRMGPFGIYT